MTETLATYSFVTLADAKAYLSRGSVTVDDDPLAILVNVVAAALETECQRRLHTRDYNNTTGEMVLDADDGGLVDRYSRAGQYGGFSLGGGIAELTALEWPVTAVAGLREVDTTGTSRTVTVTGWREIASGVIYLPNDSVSAGYANLFLSCTAGYDAALHPREFQTLRMAQLRWIQVAFQDFYNGTGRGTGMNVGGDSISLIDQAIPKDVARMLAPFKRLL